MVSLHMSRCAESTGVSSALEPYIHIVDIVQVFTTKDTPLQVKIRTQRAPFLDSESQDLVFE